MPFLKTRKRAMESKTQQNKLNKIQQKVANYSKTQQTSHYNISFLQTRRWAVGAWTLGQIPTILNQVDLIIIIFAIIVFIIGIFTVVNITIIITYLMIFVVIMFLSSTSLSAPFCFQCPHDLEDQICVLRFWNRPPASEGQFRL